MAVGGRHDLSGPLVVVIAAVVYLSHGFNGELDRDLGLYAYAGQRVADGSLPYDGLINRSGPLSHLLPGAAMALGRLVGLDDVLSARIFFLVLSLAAVYATHRLALRVFEQRWIAVTAALALVSLGGFTDYATRGPREKTAMVLFLLLALIAIQGGRWLWVGIWISLGTLTWQPVFFPAVAAALVGLALEPRAMRLRKTASVALGGLAPLALVVAIYLVAGQLRLFLDCFVVIHLRYTRQQGLAAGFGRTWELVRGGFGPSAWVLLIGLVASVSVAAAVALSPTRRRSAEGRAIIMLGALTVGAIVWCLRAFNGWPDAFLLIPSAVLGVAAVLAEVSRRLVPRVAIVLAVGCWVGALILGFTFAVGERTSDLPSQRERAEAISDLVGADATFLSIQAPSPLVLAGRVNPSRHQMFTLGLQDYVDDTWPGGMAGYAAWIEETRPEVVIMGELPNKKWIRPTLDSSYQVVGHEPGNTWYVSNDLDERTIAHLRAVLRGSE